LCDSSTPNLAPLLNSPINASGTIVIPSNTASFSAGFASSYTESSGLLSADTYATYRNFFLADSPLLKQKSPKAPVAHKTSAVRLGNCSPLNSSRHLSRPSKVGLGSSRAVISPLSPFSSPHFGFNTVTLITTILVNLMQQGLLAVKVFYRYGYVYLGAFGLESDFCW
jgi:hypothetical protein